LAVVVAATLQHRSPLALGNVVGSAISNILGAFSLGILFSPGKVSFDQSAKIYTALLLLLTTAFVACAYFGKLGKVAGGVMIAVFTVYLVSIAYAIYRGVVLPSEASDDDNSDDESCDQDDENEAGGEPVLGANAQEHQPIPSEASALLGDGTDTRALPGRRKGHVSRGLIFHMCQLFIGFVALSISGYVLSHSASTIADAINLSGTVFGLTILSFATTLPEKFVAILSGSRGHVGITVANTAGSNIFLLTLCLGIVSLTGDLDGHTNSVVPFELVVTWVSSVLLFLVVFLGLGRWMGVLLALLYVVFLILEFTIYRR
jgi:Ca2+/Na+ antiporter